MGTSEMLQRSITYEEAILRNYKQYVEQAGSTEAGDLFAQLIEEKTGQIERLRAVLKKYCKP
ncbi:MAG: hypothetical protein QHH10_02560 [Peptococcaceae bacterium]|jgi:bacterioferritin (cytochrome b1)|nr:hypothetical protein [Peptococcaceae bacterium]MDH7524181.1 hypothetical protein [Peptococcaceae bacterium]